MVLTQLVMFYQERPFYNMSLTVKTPQNRYCYPKFRVYIFGVDVTADVLSINTNGHDGDSPNTCQITLQNALDKYIVTTEDMVALLKTPITKLDIPWLNGNALDTSVNSADSGGVLEPGQTGFAERLDAGTFDPIKKKILLRKNSIVQGFSPDLRKDLLGRPIANSGFGNYYNSTIKRYPLSDGSSIFHVMDPVRVFMRDPFDTSKWYYHFTGFVSDTVDNSDENNTKTFTILAEDVTKLFRYTRIFTNPGVLDAGKVIQEQDIKVQSFHQHFLQGFNLPEIFFTLLFGPDKVGADKLIDAAHGPERKSNISTRLRGIGHFDFKYSGIFSFGPEPTYKDNSKKSINNATRLLTIKPELKLNGLDSWQNVVDHEVQPSDLWTMAHEELRDSYTADLRNLILSLTTSSDGKIDTEAVIDVIGTRPQDYLVDGGKLLMLLPRSLGVDNRNIVVNDIIQAYPLNSEWHSAGHIMHEITERIQFVMYCSPRGDIVVEPPLYDFDPDDFGVKAIPQSQFNQNISSLTSQIDDTYVDGALQGENVAPSRDRGPFAQTYIVKKSDTYRWESAQVDEKVYTIATCAKSIFYNWDGQANTGIVGDLEVVKLADLIPLYGSRQIPIAPKGYMNTPEAAKLFATITLNKLNADAHTMNIQHLPNIKLGLNRPIYIQGRNCLGTTKQISHSITWGGDFTSTTDLYAIRTWNGQMSSKNPNQPLYSTIGGVGSSPLDYSIQFKQKDPPQKTNEQILSEATTPIPDLKKNLNDALDKISSKVNKVVAGKKKGGVK